MTRERIDEIDRKILRILQSDDRASMKDRPDKIGKLSKVAVSYRVKRLRRPESFKASTQRSTRTTRGKAFSS